MFYSSCSYLFRACFIVFSQSCRKIRSPFKDPFGAEAYSPGYKYLMTHTQQLNHNPGFALSVSFSEIDNLLNQVEYGSGKILIEMTKQKKKTDSFNTNSFTDLMFSFYIVYLNYYSFHRCYKRLENVRCYSFIIFSYK